MVLAAPGPDEERGVPFVAENEPNNERASATLIASGGIGVARGIRGSLPPTGGARDLDIYKLTGAAAVPAPVVPADGGEGARHEATVRLLVDLRVSPGLATTLVLEDEAGRALATATAAPGERNGLPNIEVIATRAYFLRVAGDGHKTDAGAAQFDYRLVTRWLRLEGGDEREPNGAAASATELPSLEREPEAAGYFGWSRDEDWFWIPISGVGDDVSVSVSLQGADGVVASLAVHDGAGKRIATTRGRRRIELGRVRVPASPATITTSVHPGAAGAGFFVVVRADSGRNLDRRYVVHVSRAVSAPAQDAGVAKDLR